MDLKSNEPFWLVKNGLLNTYPSLKENARCDVLIVGGGITGSLIAHQCVADGYDTILIDKREIANGSSSATTSMLQYEIDMPLYLLTKMIGEKGAIASYKSCSEAIDQLKELTDSIKSDAGFNKKKSLYFSAKQKDTEGLEQELKARKNAGFDVKWLEAHEILKTYAIDNTYGGILSEQGASIDAFKFVHEILIHNQKKGLRVFDKTELTGTKAGKRSNEAVLNTGAIIRCKKIIYCVGYESATMIKGKFVDLISTYATVSEVEPKASKKYNDLLIWNTDRPYIYMRTTDDARLLIGGEDEHFATPQKRDALLDQKEKQLTRSFEKYLPHIQFIPDFAWTGTFGQTKDGLPYIGEHKDFKNAYFVLGFGGNGITFSVTGMQMVSNWLKDKTHLLTPYFAFGR
ncbi:NAD(P)/FAD-dependent oxidoreductase [Pedobacter montanisoli]|uniref:FAD-binding oxidoreductase n=1 Tax=Pedobacter montanisoli TaxID=2923277 RepID=A0ABS9ZYV9_9SPHI|nr:FAD-binding oxidoreductase [Pedobacter montanisoli]MCJ0743485.1 FAD-binding oxidoreductase [Pedobacter montanisoli]